MKTSIVTAVFLSVLLISGSVLAEVETQPADFKYDAKGKRDPFIPLGVQPPKPVEDPDKTAMSAVRVEGIIYDPQKGSLAVINGQVFNEGDRFANYEVKQIRKTSVVLVGADETFSVRLKSQEKTNTKEKEKTETKQVPAPQEAPASEDSGAEA